MNLLTATHITKAFTDRVLLDDIDFSINEREKIGILGINGTGKTTLLKIIGGLEEPDRGTVVMGNQVKVRYLSQTPTFHKGATVLDAVLENNVNKINEWSVESEAKSMINKLMLPQADERMDHLSGGQKKRVALANALLAPVEILILDEPTNHLDNEMTAWLEEYLINYKGALVMVTHDRYFLDRVSNRIVEIDKGKVYSYPGNYSEFVSLKAERQNMELATERKRQSMLRTELEWLARGARARSTKQKAHINRIMDMKGMKAPEEDLKVQMDSISSRMGKTTVEVNQVSKTYGDKVLIKDFEYIFLRDDRVGIVGKNGCGKSTLLKIITGNLKPDKGSVTIGQTIKIGYFSQENEYMDGSVKAIEYIKEVGEYVHTKEGTISASQIMEQFLFDGTLQWTLISKLSGGERRRLYLLRVLMSEPNVLILDEPTNDLDIQTLTILEDYLDSFDGIVITVSHDRYFLDRMVKRIFAFEEDGCVRQYEGNYSDYLLARKPEEEEVPIKKKESGGQDTRVRERKLKFTYKEEREFETIDDDISALEEKISAVDEEIMANATNSGKLAELTTEREALEKELENKTERWVYLNELYDKINEQ